MPRAPLPSRFQTSLLTHTSFPRLPTNPRSPEERRAGAVPGALCPGRSAPLRPDPGGSGSGTASRWAPREAKLAARRPQPVTPLPSAPLSAGPRRGGAGEGAGTGAGRQPELAGRAGGREERRPGLPRLCGAETAPRANLEPAAGPGRVGIRMPQAAGYGEGCG